MDIQAIRNAVQSGSVSPEEKRAAFSAAEFAALKARPGIMP
jgi:hypothetical protein